VAPPSIRADCAVCLANEATRHQQPNDLVYRALRRADVPAAKEPAGLTGIDGKRPYGLTLIPRQGGRSLTWDVTVVDAFAASYLAVNSTAAGGAVPQLLPTYIFLPIAVETLGITKSVALDFVVELVRRIAANLKTIGRLRFYFSDCPS
jgi:hypothetical protein